MDEHLTFELAVRELTELGDFNSTTIELDNKVLFRVKVVVNDKEYEEFNEDLVVATIRLRNSI
ncbi:hypothetical protein [Winogradskyella pulchriflava]|uniref:Uncharacterized protein n=1 Tax=Winogradskyella pulchriflava TaxID=1110688 RepID=A0ABV6Q8H5_9FLAO